VTDDGRNLGFAGGRDDPLLPGRDAAGFGQLFPQLRCLLGKGITRIGQGQHDDDIGAAGRELEQRHQESHRLLAQVRLAGGGGHRLGHAHVAGNLVQHQQCGLISNQFFEQPGPGCGAVPVAFFGQFVAAGSGQLIGQLPPQRIGANVVLGVVEAGGGVQVRADNPRHSHLSWLWQQGGVYHATHHVRRDMSVGSMV